MNQNMNQNSNKDPFINFKNPIKYNDMLEVNKKLNIKTISTNKLVFVYSAPKVGSTSLISSLRIFASDTIDVRHIHDEQMLQVLIKVNNVTVNEIILFNKYIGRNVYVIDVYRSPIERKMSAFFEKIGAYHFNNTDELINNYNINRIIHRFNRIFPYICNDDHFIDKYEICVPEKFDYLNKYLLVEENGITYLKLRLKDVELWNNILTSIFGQRICVVKDYETNKKTISSLYTKFKQNYKIPINFIAELKSNKYLNYYYSESEVAAYINEWSRKSGPIVEPFSQSQYEVYNEITIENSYMDYIQIQHYMDEGCKCNACNIKRIKIKNNIIRGQQNVDRIYHTEAVNELLKTRMNRISVVNEQIRRKQTPQPKKGMKNFANEMKNIVTNKK